MITPLLIVFMIFLYFFVDLGTYFVCLFITTYILSLFKGIKLYKIWMLIHPFVFYFIIIPGAIFPCLLPHINYADYLQQVSVDKGKETQCFFSKIDNKSDYEIYYHLHSGLKYGHKEYTCIQSKFEEIKKNDKRIKSIFWVNKATLIEIYNQLSGDGDQRIGKRFWASFKDTWTFS